MAIDKPLIRLTFSTQSLAETEAALTGISNGVPRAMSAGINRTLAKGKTATRRGLTRYLTIRAKNLARRLFVGKAKPQKLEGNLRVMGRAIGLINFKGDENRIKTGWGTKNSGTGVSVRVTQSGGAIDLPHAFITKGKFGNVQVFQRVRSGGKVGTRGGRFPIATKFSQRLYDLFEQSPLAQSVPAGMQADLPVQVGSQVQRLLAGK